MTFANALNALRRGHRIRRHHWRGFWEKGTYNNGNTTVIMVDQYFNATNILDTTDVMYTLENIAADDWEIVKGENASIENYDGKENEYSYENH